MPVKTSKHVLVRGKFRTLKRVNTVQIPDYMDNIEGYMHRSINQICWGFYMKLVDPLTVEGPNVSSIEAGLKDGCVMLACLNSYLKIDRTGSSNSLTEGLKPEKFDVPEGLTGVGRRGAMIAGKPVNSSFNNNVILNSTSVSQCSSKSDSEFKRSSIELGMQMIPGVETLKEQHHKKTLRRQQTITEINMRPGFNNQPSFVASEDRSKKGISFFKLEIHWSDLIPHTEFPEEDPASLRFSDQEHLRREAVWEMFKCELNFLLEHLMVLKHCFMEPLKKLQVDGHLMFVEPDDLFGNLDELCYVSYTFCRDFITTLTREMTPEEFGQTSVLVKTFVRWSQHSRNGDVFHSYCLNYENAMAYLDSLRKNEHFNEFEKWCNKDPRLQRLQLADLMVAPMQHCTKMPLLLNHIRKYTTEPNDQNLLTETLDRTEQYLRSLDEKIMWLRNYERLQEIQGQLVWPPITELEPRVFIPDFLKHILSRQPCERLIANPRRQLLHEGHLLLNEGNKVLDMYVFLFDDILILTKIKKLPKKMQLLQQQQQSAGSAAGAGDQPSMGGDCDCFCAMHKDCHGGGSGGSSGGGGGGANSGGAGNLRSPTDGAMFQVYKQPLALDRFSLHDVGTSEANANGIKHAFVLIHVSRFQQVTGVYTMQASSELSKAVWMDELSQSQQNFQEKLKQKLQHSHDYASPRTNKHSKILANIDRQMSDSPTSASGGIDFRNSRQTTAADEAGSLSNGCHDNCAIGAVAMPTGISGYHGSQFDWSRSGVSTDPSTKTTALSSSVDTAAVTSSISQYHHTNQQQSSSTSSQQQQPIKVYNPLKKNDSSSVSGYSHPQPPKDLSFLTSIVSFTPPLSPTLHQDFPTLPCGEVDNCLERLLDTMESSDCRGRSYSEPIPAPGSDRSRQLLTKDDCVSCCEEGGGADNTDLPIFFQAMGGVSTSAMIHHNSQFPLQLHHHHEQDRQQQDRQQQQQKQQHRLSRHNSESTDSQITIKEKMNEPPN